MFWVKIILIFFAILITFFLGLKLKNVLKNIVSFFFPAEEKKNKITIDEIVKVETNQGKTKASMKFLKSLKRYK